MDVPRYISCDHILNILIILSNGKTYVTGCNVFKRKCYLNHYRHYSIWFVLQNFMEGKWPKEIYLALWVVVKTTSQLERNLVSKEMLPEAQKCWWLIWFTGKSFLVSIFYLSLPFYFPRALISGFFCLLSLLVMQAPEGRDFVYFLWCPQCLKQY